jgi:hypothetical protein
VLLLLLLLPLGLLYSFQYLNPSAIYCFSQLQNPTTKPCLLLLLLLLLATNQTGTKVT